MAFNICYSDVIGEVSGKMPHTADLEEGTIMDTLQRILASAREYFFNILSKRELCRKFVML
jgi:hypothetical protein